MDAPPPPPSPLPLRQRSAARTVLELFAERNIAELAGLPRSAPLSIRSLAFSDPHHLLLGSAGGKLFLLSLDRTTAVNSVQLIRFISISTRPVDSILILPDIDRVAVLTDGCIYLVDSRLAQPPKKLTFIKEITAISKWTPAENSTFLPRMDALFDSSSQSRSERLLRKISGGVKVNGTRQRASEAGNKESEGGVFCYLCISSVKKLLIVELSVGNLMDLNSNYGGISFNVKEIAAIDGVKTLAWVGDSIVVGTVGGYSLVSVSSGKIMMLFSLPESSGLPKLRSLERSKGVLLLVDNVGIVVNSTGQPVDGSLVFQYPPESVTEISSCIVVAKDGRLDLYRRKTGGCVQSLSFAKCGSQVCITSNDDQVSGDIVVAATPYKIICLCKVSSEEQIKDLLRKKNFNAAVSLLAEMEAEGDLTKEMLSFVHAQIGFMLLFHLHFEEAVDQFLLSETMQPSEIFPFIMRDPNRWSYMVPRNRYWGLHPPPVPIEQVIDDGLAAIQRDLFLKKAGVETTVDEDFLLNPPSRADLLDKATDNIIRYLRASRNKVLTPAIHEGVDTLLMYLYRALNRVNDMEQLASSQNSCAVEELETLLDDSGHLRTLAFLYASKGMHSKALAIWRILARNYSTGFWTDPAVSLDQDTSNVLMSGQKAAAVEASKLLQDLSDQELVLEHLGWIADVDDELAVMILTSEKRANQLSPEKVLAAIDSKRVEILQRYLQWLIEVQDSDDTRFHTLYALSLARSVLEGIEMNWTSEHDAMSINQLDALDIEKGEEYRHRERLQQFLEASDSYDPEEVLDLIEVTELWLEKAILYKKLGLETQALQILALKLEDSETAEQYCAEIGRNDAYMQLLDMYLNPNNGKPPMFKAAVRLLHNHGESLDPLQVLEKLSPDMPLQLALDTILRMLRARVHHHRQGQIVHKLSQAISLDSKLARLEERMRYVQIDDQTICSSCHARLGTKLFAMFPDDSIVCYKCYRRQGISTSASGRNFKQDPIFKPGWLVSR